MSILRHKGIFLGCCRDAAEVKLGLPRRVLSSSIVLELSTPSSFELSKTFNSRARSMLASASSTPLSRHFLLAAELLSVSTIFTLPSTATRQPSATTLFSPNSVADKTLPAQEEPLAIANITNNTQGSISNPVLEWWT
jgi:hypothetical protein